MEQEPLIPEVLEPLEDSDRAAQGENRGGRPRNTTRFRTLEAMARKDAPRIVQTLINQAISGDVLAARLILDRVWPRPRTAPIDIQLPATANPAQLREAMHKVLAQVAAGDVDPAQGAAFVQIMREVLEAHRIQTFDATSNEIRTVDYRQQLTDKLLKAIEERKRLAAAAEPTPEPAPNETSG